VFSLVTSETAKFRVKEEYHGEIIRQYPDGRTLVNSGVGKALMNRERAARGRSRGICSRGWLYWLVKGYFRDFEYVSVLGCFREDDLN
jgi:hypothetical protein